MSPYILVYGSLALLLFISLINKKYVNICYLIAFLTMTLFLCFRAGQGTDYPAYEWIYRLTPDILDFDNPIYTSGVSTVEYGWWIICNISKAFGLSFEYFITLISLAEMLLINRFIRKMGIIRYKVLVLLLAYPTLYFTFLFSALRQGLVVCVFLGVMLPWFIEKKYKRYIVSALALTVIHSVAIALLLIFAVNYLSHRQIKFILLFAFVFGAFIAVTGSSLMLPVLYAIGRPSYINNFGISIFALLERLIMAAIVLYLYNECEEHDECSDTLVKYYLLGTSIYIALMALPLVTSRLCFIFKVVEIWIIPKMFTGIKKERRVQLTAVLVAVTCFMTLKNINAAINEGSYNEAVNIFNYPYVTIFEPEEIYEYRESIYY